MLTYSSYSLGLVARGEADLSTTFVINELRYAKVYYLPQPVDVNRLNIIISPLPKTSFVPFFGPFNTSLWLFGALMFAICCFLLSFRENNGFSWRNVVDTIYALPFLQKDKRYRWIQTHCKILMCCYCFSAKLMLVLYAAEFIQSLTTEQMRKMPFSKQTDIMNAFRTGKYRLIIAKNSYMERALLSKEKNNRYILLRDALKNYPPKVS